MKIQSIFFSIITVASYAAMVSANETTDKKNNKIETTSMASTHTDGHGTAIKDQPFWSKEQTKQAALEKKYKNKIADNTEDKQVYTHLAGLYLTNNKTAAAIDAYQDAITHNPKNPKLFAAISIAYLHQSKFSMAKAMADEALRLDPSLTQVGKINEYIVAKQDALQAASNISLKQAREQGLTPGQAPKDATHGSKSGDLQIDNPFKWTEAH